MSKIKDELQYIILGDGPAGQTDHLKKVQLFLRRNEETGVATQKKQRVKGEKTSELLTACLSLPFGSLCKAKVGVTNSIFNRGLLRIKYPAAVCR